MIPGTLGMIAEKDWDKEEEKEKEEEEEMGAR